MVLQYSLWCLKEKSTQERLAIEALVRGARGLCFTFMNLWDMLPQNNTDTFGEVKS